MLIGLTFISYTASQSVSVSDMWSNLTLRVIMGTILGVKLIHFWVDTFIWKFSGKGIRNLHGEAFNFQGRNKGVGLRCHGFVDTRL